MKRAERIKARLKARRQLLRAAAIPFLMLLAGSIAAQEALPFPTPPMGGKVGPTMQESVHKWREQARHLPEDAPNILIVNGFFIPNDRKKYSGGENAGMKLDENGGIEVYVAAEKPEGVPEENWLSINRKDEDMDIVLRIYIADLEKMKTWQPPTAEKLAE